MAWFPYELMDPKMAIMNEAMAFFIESAYLMLGLPLSYRLKPFLALLSFPSCHLVSLVIS